ncbi:MAG: hypothetical protein ACO3J2_03590 [Chthoniobacterales bacterium]|jgi:hypothetical protein
MKAKNRITHRRSTRREDPLPHEVGTHLFALIKRNLLARRQPAGTPSPSQLTFAF